MTSIVATQQGRLAGRESRGVHVFRGIPYARPPVGARRFRPPQPPEPWPGTRDATRFGPSAPQSPWPLAAIFDAITVGESEDCLTLNVWTPGLDGARRPVLVWIHGGAFVGGAGSTPWYDGTAFAARGDVVVVTLNYRLGTLGFLHLADLLGDAYIGSGNVGILDQVAALTWVRENIAAFGGDPDNVTVFGESAGAMSVGALLGLPAARGLFRRAILQSGAAHDALTRRRATELALQVLDALWIDRADAATLVRVPVEPLLLAQSAIVAANWETELAFQPVVDGDTLPARPIDAVAAGSAAGVSLLVGTNLDEMHLFMAFDPTVAVTGEADALRRCARIFGAEERAAAALATYRRARPAAAVGDLWSAVLTDHDFRMPAVRLAEAQGRVQPQTWMYLFTRPSPAFGGGLGACHALEIPFVFNTLDAPGAAAFTGGTTPEAKALADAMQDAWIAFARTGDPNHPGLPAWPPYEPAQRATMIFGPTCAVAADPYAEERRLWDGLR